MITAIDTNVLIALWEGDDGASSDLQKILDDASEKGSLSICGAVFAELLASPRITESFIEEFCADTGISSTGIVANLSGESPALPTGSMPGTDAVKRPVNPEEFSPTFLSVPMRSKAATPC